MEEEMLISALAVKVPKGLPCNILNHSIVFLILNSYHSTIVKDLQLQFFSKQYINCLCLGHNNWFTCIIIKILMKEGYHFALFPKYLQAKGFILHQLPQFSLSAFIGNYRVDEATFLPVREQKLYHTIFWLTSQRLEFECGLNNEEPVHVRIQVYDGSALIGKMLLNCQQYISSPEEEKEHYYCEKAKLSDTYELEFELFAADSELQLESIILQYHGESDIRTPLTKQSQDRFNDSELNVDLMVRVESELYSPPQNVRRSLFQKIDEEESINSSLPQNYIPTASPQKLSFKIQSRVGGQYNKKDEQRRFYDSRQMKKMSSSSWGERVSLWVFGITSLLMIYLSTLPIKKI